MPKKENLDEVKQEFLKRFKEFGSKDLTEIKCSSKKCFEEEKENWYKKKTQ